MPQNSRLLSTANVILKAIISIFSKSSIPCLLLMLALKRENDTIGSNGVGSKGKVLVWITSILYKRQTCSSAAILNAWKMKSWREPLGYPTWKIMDVSGENASPAGTALVSMIAGGVPLGRWSCVINPVQAPSHSLCLLSLTLSPTGLSTCLVLKTRSGWLQPSKSVVFSRSILLAPTGRSPFDMVLTHVAQRPSDVWEMGGLMSSRFQIGFPLMHKCM